MGCTRLRRRFCLRGASNLISALDKVLVAYAFGVLVIVVAAAAIGRFGAVRVARGLFSLAFWGSVITPLVFLVVFVT